MEKVRRLRKISIFIIILVLNTLTFIRGHIDVNTFVIADYIKKIVATRFCISMENMHQWSIYILFLFTLISVKSLHPIRITKITIQSMCNA